MEFCFRFQELDYYDRDDGYGSPKAPSYSAPAPSYEAPAPQYSAPSDSYGAPSHSGGGDGFNDFLNALAAFLPIGLFLAATISSISCQSGQEFVLFKVLFCLAFIKDIGDFAFIAEAT